MQPVPEEAPEGERQETVDFNHEVDVREEARLMTLNLVAGVRNKNPLNPTRAVRTVLGQRIRRWELLITIEAPQELHAQWAAELAEFRERRKELDRPKEQPDEPKEPDEDEPKGRHHRRKRH